MAGLRQQAVAVGPLLRLVGELVMRLSFHLSCLQGSRSAASSSAPPRSSSNSRRSPAVANVSIHIETASTPQWLPALG